jgi:hypothetical protein
MAKSRLSTEEKIIEELTQLMTKTNAPLFAWNHDGKPRSFNFDSYKVCGPIPQKYNHIIENMIETSLLTATFCGGFVIDYHEWPDQMPFHTNKQFRHFFTTYRLTSLLLRTTGGQAK